jgi:hypothetical protein
MRCPFRDVATVELHRKQPGDARFSARQEDDFKSALSTIRRRAILDEGIPLLNGTVTAQVLRNRLRPANREIDLLAKSASCTVFAMPTMYLIVRG